MTEIEKIRETVNYICYEKYIKLAYGGDFCGNVGCYDLRDYNEFFNLFSTVKPVTTSIIGNVLTLNGAHAYANIKIYSGSYAKLICNQS